MKSATVAVVEPDGRWREEVQKIISRVPKIKSVHTYHRVQDALAFLPMLQPDLVMVEMELDELNGPLFIRKLIPLMPQTKFMVFAHATDEWSLYKALRAGATGYLLKNCRRKGLALAIGEMLAAGASFSPVLQRCLAMGYREAFCPPPLNDERLSKRENDVFRYTFRSLSNQEIASELHISRATVKGHWQKIFSVMDVKNREALRRKMLSAHGI